MNELEAIIQPLCGIDWEDLRAVEGASHTAFAALLEDRSLIQQRVADLPERPELLRLCEHYDILDKIVLHDDPSGVRLRLHVFLPGYFDRPHNHRWTYASTILRGGYRHYLYGAVDLDEHVDPLLLRALMIRKEQAGNAYALHHTMVHAVVAEPYTVSLVIRGPAVKNRFLVMDRQTGEAWWQYGARQETDVEAAKKRMSVERVGELTKLLAEWDLFWN